METKKKCMDSVSCRNNFDDVINLDIANKPGYGNCLIYLDARK